MNSSYPQGAQANCRLRLITASKDESLQMGNACDLIVQKLASNPLPQADLQILEE
jgi:hypothetical protein